MRHEYVGEADIAMLRAKTPGEARRIQRRYMRGAQDDEERRAINFMGESIAMWENALAELAKAETGSN